MDYAKWVDEHLDVFDNGGETIDRYMAMRKVEPDEILWFSENHNLPTGLLFFSEYFPEAVYGKKLTSSDLDQRQVIMLFDKFDGEYPNPHA